MLRNDTLWVANVGDSRAVLGRRNKRTVENSSSNSVGSNSSEASGRGLCAIDLSTDQNANDLRERDGILAVGGGHHLSGRQDAVAQGVVGPTLHHGRIGHAQVYRRFEAILY